MGDPVEQCGCHLGAAARPLAECQIDGDDDAGALVELLFEVEEQTPTSLGERDSRVHRAR
jgi:hypothetical protein